MKKAPFSKSNMLGDLTAEADGVMLERAFLETGDYRTLIETSDRIVVVGRRGTGKSALTLWLERYWRKAESTDVIKLAPEEYQVIGLRPLLRLFGDKFSLARAGSRLLWRYAFMLEAATSLALRPEFPRTDDIEILRKHLERWSERGPTLLERFRNLIDDVVDGEREPEERIGDLPVLLDLQKLEVALISVCKIVHTKVVFLIDRLDEGYQPDDIGIGMVDGLVQAAIDLKTRFPGIRSVIFLRDNIFRAIQHRDLDYSRSIEGHVLRLHWEETSLFAFATSRIKVALDIPEESSEKIWNACAAADLKGRQGFYRCLQLTLYRPRDVVALLNEALYIAGKRNENQLSFSHLEATAKSISQNRLEDLKKEYGEMLPGLDKYIGVFHGQQPELDVAVITPYIERLLSIGSDDPVIQQDFLILSEAQSVLRGLFSVGFLGIRDPATGSFAFCHDGRAPDREITLGDKVLVHPCYCMALNCGTGQFNPGQIAEIYDEYDIEIYSETPKIRVTKIDGLIEDLNKIPLGQDGDVAFEVWCHNAIRICFAKGLRNVELKANKNARQRRDVVGTNLGDDGVWKRMREDYGTRQVTFEIKNYVGIAAADFQQISSYLHGEYGRIGFVVTRDETVDLYAGRDVEWVRDIYLAQQKLVIKLTGKYLVKLLYKLRNPQKHDTVNNALHQLLDTYTRLYLAGQTKTDAREGKRQSRKKERKLKALSAAAKNLLSQ